MGKINWGRVFLGGLLCGLVANVLGIPGWLLYSEELRAAIAPERPFLTPELMAIAITVFFVLGIVTIWLYAAIRPRYGPGPKTAAIAGFAVWLIVILADAIWVSAVRVPIPLAAKAVGGYLVISVVATVVGAWPYKE